MNAQYVDYEIMTKHEMGYNDLKTLSQEEKKKLLKMEYSYN
jgi:ABC-type transporter MlaC component